MKWVKKGLIFNANHHFDWAVEGAIIPTPIVLNNDTIRLFLNFLDDKGVGRTGFVDVKKDNLNEVVNISKKPVFDIGQPGCFDENGGLTCSVNRTPDNTYHVYYVGFELGKKIRYKLFTGLTILDSNFEVLKKYNVPVLDRTCEELFFRCGPHVLFEKGIYKIWYVAGSAWQKIEGKEMPVYEICYLESKNGINWGKKGKKCIVIENDDEHGFGRPYVIKHKGIYKMFYSIRVKKIGYRLGYAESKDGIHWERKDDLMNLDTSSEGFDDQMICYSAVIEINDKLVMFYNGNDFGKTGFGYAELEF